VLPDIQRDGCPLTKGNLLRVWLEAIGAFRSVQGSSWISNGEQQYAQNRAMQEGTFRLPKFRVQRGRQRYGALTDAWQPAAMLDRGGFLL
jgi:hypothetical protein